MLTALLALGAFAQTDPASLPREMKLLVISKDGGEPTLQAAQAFLDQIGIPYQTAYVTCPASLPACAPGLPPLEAEGHGLFQGIVMAEGQALAGTDWTTLDDYALKYAVRTLVFYTWPMPQYGLTYAGANLAQPVSVSLTTAGKPLFPYLKTSAIAVSAYGYNAVPAPETGGKTEPILTTAAGTTVGTLYTNPKGREFLSLTFDSNPYLLHALTLNYGLFNWVTKGAFLGARRIYLSPQIDDMFIPDTLFTTVAPCNPGGFAGDPPDGCPEYRMSALDLQRTVDWTKALDSSAQTKNVKLLLAYNGVGTAAPRGEEPKKDALTKSATNLQANFYWTNHTYSHPNLDRIALVNGQWAAGSYDDYSKEIQKNITVANALKLKIDRREMVTPEYSGLQVPAFMSAAYDAGVRYLALNLALSGPVKPNTGVWSFVGGPDKRILLVPRQATNIFYNTHNDLNDPGSQVEEYNYFYGPNGISRDGFGNAFFPTDQTYDQILDTESNNILTYMLQCSAWPLMFHQANLYNYRNQTSLVRDVIDKTLSKFTAISNLPVTSMSLAGTGELLEARMAYNEAQQELSAVLDPAAKIITLSTKTKTVTIPITAGTACPAALPQGATCTVYGKQAQVNVRVTPATPVQLTF